MKSFYFLTVLLLASSSIFASESTLKQNISCQGTDVSVFGTAESNILLLNLPNSTISVSLPIVEVIPMFPVYSVTAKKELRLFGGSLTVATLTIRTEAIGANGGKPGTLKVETTTLKGHHSVDTYQVACSIK